MIRMEIDDKCNCRYKINSMIKKKRNKDIKKLKENMLNIKIFRKIFRINRYGINKNNFIF